ncbi:MAG: hypothetical protein HY319_18335 [Armatimonadetes bacterium]|nr:hypothetical protein [Armatimonadota bacterium]
MATAPLARAIAGSSVSRLKRVPGNKLLQALRDELKGVALDFLAEREQPRESRTPFEGWVE